MSQYRYCEIVKGGVNRRGTVMDLGDKKNTDLDYYGKLEVRDAFHSAFMHTKDFQLYDDGKGGKAGYDGPVEAYALYWDFDAEDPADALTDTRELVNRLTNDWLYLEESNIRVYYSGNKGFHVVYLCPELAKHTTSEKHTIVKKACAYIAGRLTTLDGKIYAKTQLIRTPNSRHSVTGLVKIELSIDEVRTLDIEKIKELATGQRVVKHNIDPDWQTLNDSLEQVIERSLNEKATTDNETSSENWAGGDILDCIEHGGSVTERNNAFASLCGLLHSRGFDSDFLERFCNTLNRALPDPLPEAELARTIRSISRYRVDPQYRATVSKDIVTVGEALDKHIQLRQRVDRIDTGFSHLNTQLPFFDPGEVFMVCARSGGMKTTWSMQLANNIARNTVGKALFASLEMPDHSIGLRAAVMEANREGDQKDTWTVSKELEQRKELYEKVKSRWSNMLIVDKSSLTMEQIESYYRMAQDMTGNMMQCLLVDYVGLVNGAVNYEGTSKIAKALKGLAKDLNTRLIVVVQLSRAAMNGRVPVEMHMLRDSGSLEEGADYIYGSWISPEDHNRLHVKALKNRWLGERDAMFDLVNRGLSLTSTDYLPDPEQDSGYGSKW